MANYSNSSNKLLLRGINLTLPGDRLSMEWAQSLRNLRSYRVGQWRQRPGFELVADIDGVATDSILWERRINNPSAGTYRRLVGTSGGKVYVDDAAHAVFSLVDSGYSSEPYSSVISRPDGSNLPYLLLANSQRLGKFSITGQRTEWGLAAPIVPLTAELARNVYKVIDLCDATAGFTGTGGVVSLQNRVSAVAISHILYDSGTTGWACVSPASMDETWQEGMFITTSGGPETVIIESTYPAIVDTTVGSILYDSGTTGLCTIQLATASSGLQRNSFIRLNSSENVRVLSVTMGLDGIPSFRCSTVGTISAGQAVAGLKSFRAYFTSNHTTAETLSASYVQLAVAASGLSYLSKTSTLDLSTTNTGASRPIQDDDYIHLSVRVADFTSITELQIQFDVDGTTNDFTQNYYFKSIRQPDLLAAVNQTASSITAQQQSIQRTQIDDYTRQQLLQERDFILSQNVDSAFGGIGDARQERLAYIDAQLGGGFVINSGQGTLSQSGATGDDQWTELKIPVKEFQRVGSDMTRGWKDVKAFQLTANTTGAVNVGLDALWIGGSYGPDVTNGQTIYEGYTYVWRGRNTSTGSVSNPSPPTRSPILPEREGVQLTIPSGYADPQADVFDVFRRGGTLGAYHYVASIPSSTLTYTDTLPDDVVVRQPLLQFDRFKPWPRAAGPQSGTCDVTGTRVKFLGGFVASTSWLRNTQIIINQQVYSFYSPPVSVGGVWYVELNESCGSLSGVSFEIPEPYLDGQALPCVFGPYGGGVSGEFILGIGDPLNPGRVYWTNGNDPESVSDSNYLDLCDPSEVLVMGTVLDGITYVFSDRRSWRILPSFAGGQSEGGSNFYAQETGMGKGLASKWALATGDQLYFLSFDGIYASKGDVVNSLTDDSLTPLFRRDGGNVLTTSLQGISPISFSPSDEKYLALIYSKDGLYFSYKGLDGNLYTLYYSFLTQGWMQDTHTPVMTRIFREEGSTVDVLLLGSQDGRLYRSSDAVTTDNGSSILCRFLSREEDWDDSRSLKAFGDVMIDVDPASNVLTGTFQFDNNTSTSPFDQTLTGSARTRLVRGMPFGADKLARSVAVEITWGSIVTSIPTLYEWSPSALQKPDVTILRSTDWDTGGYEGPKWVQGMRLRADTFNVAKTLTIQYDEGLTGATPITATHNGEVTKEYSWTPFIAHQMRIVTQDQDPWRFFIVEWIYEPEPPLATRWDIQPTSLDIPAYAHVRDMIIAHRSTADITLEEIVDGVSATYPIPNSAASVVRSYVKIAARKGKTRKYVLTSTEPFSLYLKDLGLRVGAWGRNEPYVILRPFGDTSRENGGARV